MNKIKKMIELFEYNTEDIENVLYKPFLKTAIISHITEQTKYPKSFVKSFVDLVFLSEDI